MGFYYCTVQFKLNGLYICLPLFLKKWKSNTSSFLKKYWALYISTNKI